MGARIERAAAQRHEIVEFHSHALQPFKRRVRAGRQLLDQIQIADLVAAVPRLECKPVRAVKQGFVRLFVGFKLFLHGRLKRRMLFTHRRFIQRGLHEGILIAGNLRMILKLRIGCVVNAARHDGVSA